MNISLIIEKVFKETDITESDLDIYINSRSNAHIPVMVCRWCCGDHQFLDKTAKIKGIEKRLLKLDSNPTKTI